MYLETSLHKISLIVARDLEMTLSLSLPNVWDSITQFFLLKWYCDFFYTISSTVAAEKLILIILPSNLKVK